MKTFIPVLRKLTGGAAIFSLLLVSWCGKSTAQSSSINLVDAHATTLPATAKAPAPVTIDEWRQALGSAYEEMQTKSASDGVTTFMAMFPKKGGVGAFGQQDAFNKVYIFKPFSTELDWNLGPNVRVYVLVPVGGSPVVVVSPMYWGRNGYLSLQKLAILVDGELAFERTFQTSDVVRGHYGAGINETAKIVLSGEALMAFRKIKKESTVAIRLSGERGYVNLKKDGIDPITSFRSAIIDSLFIYDSVDRATKDHLSDQKSTQL